MQGDFAHPHMRALESSGRQVWVGWLSSSSAAARGAMRSAACRRGRRALGLASGDLCSKSLHHLISGRIALIRTHIPHACGEEATRMRPIYKSAWLSAQGWHGHHPSRADRDDCRGADALVWGYAVAGLSFAPVGTRPVVRKRHNATISLRAKATMAMRLIRLLTFAVRSRNHCVSALSG